VPVKFKYSKIVVVFDVCSSSQIMEDLLLSERFDNYELFLGCIKRWLFDQLERDVFKAQPFDLYKFTGDGWVLLFPSATDGTLLVSFMRGLCEAVDGELARHILPYLNTNPPELGVTIGVDKGSLVKLTMRGQDEYVGRPLNIAFRLQNAVKEVTPYGNMALVSKQIFNDYFGSSTYKAEPVNFGLRNINSGRDFSCWRIDFALDNVGQDLPFPRTDGPESKPGQCARSRPR